MMRNHILEKGGGKEAGGINQECDSPGAQAVLCERGKIGVCQEVKEFECQRHCCVNRPLCHIGSGLGSVEHRLQVQGFLRSRQRVLVHDVNHEHMNYIIGRTQRVVQQNSMAGQNGQCHVTFPAALLISNPFSRR